MSELKVNKVTPRSGTTVTLGDSGDTITIPSGVTLSGFSANTPAFSAKRSGSGNSLTANVNTLVVFDSELFDTDSAYSTVTGKFIIPSGKAGKYFFTGSVTMATSFTYGIAFLYKNGSENFRGMAVQNDASSVVVSAIIDCAEFDEIQLFAHSSSTQNVTASSYFQGFKLI
jgi:hypothetical protein